MEFVKRILVTGGCGFIGSHMVRKLVKEHKDWLIINMDNLSYAAVIDNLKDIENEENYRFEPGDVTDEMLLSMILANYDVTDVIHMAAQSHVDRSISGPMDFVYNNTVGTVALLEVVRQYWMHAYGSFEGRKFYYFSTDEVYGFLDKNGKAFTEGDKLNPTSPYSASKAAGDLFCKAYHKTYGMPVVISHMCNAYGPNQFPEKLIPATIERILADEPIIVYDQGKQVREWIYVEDAVDAACEIFQKSKAGESYNIGTGNEAENITVVKTLIELACMRTGKDANEVTKNIQYVENARPGHDFRYAINCRKLEKEIGWKSSVALSQGLDKTVEWYLANREWVDDIKTGKYVEHNQEHNNAIWY